MARGWVRGVGVLGVVVASGCGSGRGVLSEARPPAKTQHACLRAHPPPSVAAAAAQDRGRQGAQVVLATAGSNRLAYVADEDDGSIHVIDVGSMLERTTFDAGGTPGQMMMLADGRLVVTLRDKAQVRVFEPSEGGTMVERCAVDTATEPVGLAMSPDDATVVVTSGWGHALTALDGGDLHRKYQVELPREPRSVIVSDDGAKAYVAHAVGSAMSVVDLRADPHAVTSIGLKGHDERPRFKAKRVHDGIRKRRAKTLEAAFEGTEKVERLACQGFALAKSVAPTGRVLAPQVLVENGDTREPSDGYGSMSGGPSEVPDVAVIDQGSDRPFEASLLVRSDRSVSPHETECLLPRAAAVDPASGSLFVTCLGSDTLVEYDAASTEPHRTELRRWRVASGPMGLAIDAASHRALVWSQFDRTLNAVPLGDAAEPAPVMRLALSRRSARAEMADLALGRRLFHAAGDERIASDGRACASCHPDGRDDTITWATPDGPRQTPMLAGRIEGTAPYAWVGSGDDVSAHLGHTFSRLRGRGLEKHELEALVAYVTQMTPPPREGDANTARLERGSQIFHSTEAGCASCHGKNGRDPDGLRHDVSSRATSDVTGEFDTPSLRFIGGSAPYFHDGRYTSLRALLVETDGRMGKVSHLAPGDLDALEAYVRTL
ncbi:hypothetical protein LVJ94_06750 [Pendulispora rubella]|uniref:Cytochrome c domain-containing protein n=1 Tax=Pendulispora rubella TaxID=2741070 RepID=A0ABZ2L7N6_9BACT